MFYGMVQILDTKLDHINLIYCLSLKEEVCTCNLCKVNLHSVIYVNTTRYVNVIFNWHLAISKNWIKTFSVKPNE